MLFLSVHFSPLGNCLFGFPFWAHLSLPRRCWKWCWCARGHFVEDTKVLLYHASAAGLNFRVSKDLLYNVGLVSVLYERRFKKVVFNKKKDGLKVRSTREIPATQSPSERVASPPRISIQSRGEKWFEPQFKQFKKRLWNAGASPPCERSESSWEEGRLGGLCLPWSREASFKLSLFYKSSEVCNLPGR